MNAQGSSGCPMKGFYNQLNFNRIIVACYQSNACWVTQRTSMLQYVTESQHRTWVTLNLLKERWHMLELLALAKRVSKWSTGNQVGSTRAIDLYWFRYVAPYIEWRVDLLSHVLCVYKGWWWLFKPNKVVYWDDVLWYRSRAPNYWR
jgi:hypothetical protein